MADMQKTFSRLDRFFRRLKPLLADKRLRSPPLDTDKLARFLQAVSLLLEAKAQEGHAADIWHVVGLDRNEVRTARVLAWLLDPSGSHGFGGSVLDALWSHISPEIRPFALTTVQHVQREAVPLGNGENRVDIEILGADFLLIIEVKIDAAEQPNQLQRYAEIARSKAQFRQLRNHCVLYLTCRRRPQADSHAISITWADVAKAIQRASHGRPQTAPGTQLALAFAAHIRNL